MLEDAGVLFEAAGFGLPPVPESLIPSLKASGRWFFSSSNEVLVQDLYFMDRIPLQLLLGAEVPDHVTFGHCGHWTNSYLAFELVFGRLALFGQTLWGGASTDPERATAEVGRRNRLAHDLVDAFDAAGARGALPEAGRLVVVDSGRGMDVFGWVDEPLGEDAARRWLRAAGGRGREAERFSDGTGDRLAQGSVSAGTASATST